MKWSLLTICSLLLAACAADVPEPDALPVARSLTDGDVAIDVEVNPGELIAGEKATLTVTVVAPADTTITMPTIEDELGDFAVRDWQRPPDVPTADGRRWQHRYVIDTFAVGLLEVPGLSIGIADDAGERDVTTDVLTLDVASVRTEGEEAPRAIQGPVELDVPGERNWLAWGGAAAGLLLVAALLVVLRRTGAAALAAAPVPAHVRALAGIADLRDTDLSEPGAFECLYDELSRILREYLEGRFGIHAPERTTEEFLADARARRELSDAHQRLLGAFLRAADLVKFARQTPEGADAIAALDAGERFVIDTAPRGEDAS